MTVPETTGKSGHPFKHPRPSVEPTTVKKIASQPEGWESRQITEGVKGPIYAKFKCLRCVAYRSSTAYGNYLTAEEDVWLYIRRHEDGTVKYFLSNALETTAQTTMDHLATSRWSIE